MKGFGGYFLTVLAGIAVVGTVAWAFTDAAGRQTVVVSALVTAVVQAAAFATTRALSKKQMWVGWGLGSLIRLISLVLYAVIVARLWRAPITPALLSFAGMLFVTTVVEPIFLKR